MWLSINNSYECSIDGQIRNKKTQRILKTWLANGYVYGRIGGANSTKTGIHRVVASLFLPSPTDEKTEVDHIDRNKLNNHASNLRWVSRSVNQLNKNKTTKPHKNNKLGELYISKSGNSYLVKIKGVYHGCFNLLDEAIKYRDSVIECIKS